MSPADRAAWAQAVRDGRVLAFPPHRFVSYPTTAERERAEHAARAAGVPVRRVPSTDCATCAIPHPRG